MMSLKVQDNRQKAQLLHTLFPDEIAGLITYTLDMATGVTTCPELVLRHWNNRNLAVELWIDLALEIRTRIVRCNSDLITNSNLFSELLFDGLLAAFCMHCLFQYVRQGKYKDLKFRTAVTLLFCTD